MRGVRFLTCQLSVACEARCPTAMKNEETSCSDLVFCSFLHCTICILLNNFTGEANTCLPVGVELVCVYVKCRLYSSMETVVKA